MVQSGIEKSSSKSPDGGWGLIVCASAFFIHVIVDGVVNTFGLIEIELRTEFNEAKAITSWIPSIMSGMVLCIGPIASLLVEKYGCRSVTIAGSLLTAVSLFVSALANNILTLIITVGFGVGCGLGLIYLPAIVCVTIYFEKYRSIATGIAVSGTGVGTLIFSHLVDFLIKKYYWRSTLIILSGIVLVCAILGTLFRPLITTQQIDATEREHSDNCETDDFCDIKSKRNGNCKQKSRANSLSTLSTDDEATNSNDTQYTSTQSLLTHSSESCKHENTSLTHAGEQWRNEIFSRWSLSYQNNCKSSSFYDCESCSVSKYGSINPDYSQDLPPITFWRSIYQKIAVFSNFLDFSLLKNPIFIIFALSNFATGIGYYIPNFSLPDYSDKSLGIIDGAKNLLALSGFVNILSRIFWGFICDKPFINRLWVNNISIITGGIAIGLFAICTDFLSLAACLTILTFVLGAFVTLRSVIITDLFGIENLENAFGLVLLFDGVATFIGSPIVGYLYDRSHSYTSGFVFAGAIVTLSGIMPFFIK